MESSNNEVQNVQNFHEMELSEEILGALKVLHYEQPTEIQSQVVPMALQGRDIIGKSQTGSGKTAAFAIPICEAAVWDENMPECLVLEPTRELTVQVKEEVFQIGRNKRLKVQDVFGGFPIDKQIQTLKQKSHIIVGTPGRMMDHIRRESLKLSKIKCIVIDEADLMLDMGFLDEVSEIIESVGHKVQMMLFSATIGDSLQQMIDKYMKEPFYAEVEAKVQTAEHVTQEIYEVMDDEKYATFKRILLAYNPERAMIFCGTKQMVDVLCRKLARDKIICGMLHGDLEQSDRLRTIRRFQEGAFRYLIATDVAARGIDIEDLSHVFNYDFPTGREPYVHRIGRTGRNGKSGCAVSLVGEEDRKMRNMVETYIGMKIPVRSIEELPKENPEFWKRQQEKIVKKERKGAGFDDSIMRLSIGGGKKSKMRAGDVVGTICSIDGVTAEDIGIIDVRDSLVYVEILHKKGNRVLQELQTKTIKGKVRKVRRTR